MTRVALLLPLLPTLMMAGCAFSDPSPAPAPTATTSAGAPTIEEACRRESERVVLFRDRGQQMRIDEGENRLGSQTSISNERAQSDIAGRSYERDRLARDCVRQSAARPR
ncbi:hypothetical protein [Plastoroseomonas arctica]|uniref:Lipoprotein n=1 Tax=Plastoroseomonas arctica TaxID=1509237 RepID=A0AAF1JU99_9PROT|nr:hypothetical protein [Plastoroseomonas arctica]MBR0653722.1 hypothetical protein [Plastoroseomonas arctica]